MDIKRTGSPPAQGPAEYFVGTVRIAPIIRTQAPARLFAASVTFEPSARPP
jgi:hypothetical protein